MSERKINYEVTITNATEAQESARKIAAQIKALAGAISTMPVDSVTTQCRSVVTSAEPLSWSPINSSLEAFASRVTGRWQLRHAHSERIRDDIRAQIIYAVTDLAAACRAHGWWKDANDLLLDAAEHAFAEREAA